MQNALTTAKSVAMAGFGISRQSSIFKQSVLAEANYFIRFCAGGV
jgi:hypothetical protein